MRQRISAIMNLLRRNSLDWLFPRTCRVCGQSLVVGENDLCLNCLVGLPRTMLHKVDFNTVHQRIGGVNNIDIAAGWFYYYSDSPYADLIRAAKYNDRPALARRLARMYGSELLADGLAGRFDVLLPVPLHKTKLLRRGYNQSEEIAKGLAEELGCAVGDNLVALRTHATQTRRGSYERFVNVKGTYGVVHPGELDGLHIAVVDDIITTGSTLLDCVSAICSAATPASISVLSLGVTGRR